ncbi:MAG: alpha/beta hydrolase family protein [Limisphaerales bacterium]
MKPSLLATFLLLAVDFSTNAQTNLIAPLLARDIIGPNLALAEVQNYTENRIPLMPAVKSAAEWEKEAARLRRAAHEEVIFRGEARAWRDAKTKVEWLDTVPGGAGYSIRKLRYEILPGLWAPALLYLPEKISGKVPVHLAVNGHDGAGKAAPYKQIRCINLAKRGVISLNLEWLGMGQLRTPGFAHYAMNQLDLCGSSGIAPFYLGMSRGLDILLALPEADPARVAVSGLSGGGWETMFLSSLDTRVTLANPVAGYSSFRTRARNFSDLGDSEQTPSDLATVVDYAHLTAMLAPRAALLTYNAKDQCCFATGHALQPLLDAAQPVFKLFKADTKLRWHNNHVPGTHNFEQENREVLYRMLGDNFFPGDTKFEAKEIPAEAEVKKAEELNVPLPADNLDFNQLALRLAKNLPLGESTPLTPASLPRWQQTQRAFLGGVVRAKHYTVNAELAGREITNGLTVTSWRLKLGDAWTVPAVEFSQGVPLETVLLVGDAGRRALAPEVDKLLAEGKRVVAVDPFYFGESRIAQKDFLFALLVASVGDRPLGLQASQLTAAARWLSTDRKFGPVKLVSIGPRASVFATIAAALEEKAIGSLELCQPLGSLRELIEKNVGVDRQPELFCFGLLEQFDVPQLRALVAPRTVQIQ